MKSKYDRSTKPFEVLIKKYLFDEKTRQLFKEPKWKHFSYYNTRESANDAVRDFRISYPQGSFSKYTTRNRFKAVDRNDKIFNGWGEYL